MALSEMISDWLDGLSPWLVVGFVGQGLFFGRFFIQWIVSERRGESHIPLAFWFFSVAGGTTLLIYAIHRRDPVFIAGQGGGLLIYFRNLTLIYRKKRRARSTPEGESREGTAGET